MSTSHILTRLLANRYVLALVVLCSLVVVVGLFVRELWILMGTNGLHAVAIEDEQETIGVLLVGLGVLLEGRELWTRKFAGLEVSETTHGNLNFACEFYGFHLLVLGLLIEVLDQGMAFFSEYFVVVAIFEYGLYLPLNLLAICLLGVTLWQILTAREALKPSATNV